MTQKKKGRKVASPLVSILIIIGVLIYYQFNGYYDDTQIKQTDYSYKKDIVETVDSDVSSDLEIYFFDVGQADSILISNSGEYMLIDAGNNSDGKLIVSQLKSMGVTKIKYLVGTHPHEDHIGGLDDVINNFEIDTLYMPKRQANTKTFEDVLDAVEKSNLKITSPKVGNTFYLGEALCEIISANADAEDTNDSSIVISLSFGNTKYLFTGDIGENIESSCSWEDIDVLKVAHHGSRYSSTTDFLNVTNPEIAVISVGEENDYGHPHEEALKRLKNINAKIYRTDESGTIYLKSNGDNISVKSLDILLDGN